MKRPTHFAVLLLSSLQLILCNHTIEIKPHYLTNKERKSPTNDELEWYLPDVTSCLTLQSFRFESRSCNKRETLSTSKPNANPQNDSQAASKVQSSLFLYQQLISSYLLPGEKALKIKR